MLKSVQISSYPQLYGDLYTSMINQADDEKTLSAWISKVEKYSNQLNFKDEDEKNKFKGDMLEVFSEIFFLEFMSDPRFGITNYVPVALEDDYGVDATGINVNGDNVVVQVKYRSNPNDKIEYSDIAKTFTAGVKRHDLDPNVKNNIYVFSTSFEVTYACDEIFKDSIIKVMRHNIERKVDNNKIFWDKAAYHIYKYLNN